MRKIEFTQADQMNADADDDASHSTCATFSSDEGDEDDWADYHHDVDTVLADINRNSRSLQKLHMFPYLPTALDPDRWIAMGQDLGRNTELKYFSLSGDGLEEDDAINSTRNLEAFCRGLSRNRSMKFLMIQEFDFDRARLAILHPFVVENPMLVDFRLHQCNLDAVDVEMLAAAFRWRKYPASMKTIDISGRTIGDDVVPMIVELCNCCPQLKKLVLTYSNIGNRGCRELASLLEDRNSTLRCLYLEGNPFSDEGGLAFANAIASNGNTKLQRLDLGASLVGRDMTIAVWNRFQTIVGDGSSINATYQSNHMLHRLWDSVISDLPPEDLRFSLLANTDKNKATAARKKIVHFHLRGDFDLALFLGMEVEVLPIVLGWIGKGRGDEDIGRSSFSAFYRILRNIPELRGYCLPDRKVRLQLEAQNASLQSDIDNLRRQNEHLLRENERLRANKRSRKD